MGIKNQKIGITGVSGFVGSHLLKHMEKKGITLNSFKGDLLSEKDLIAFFKKYKPTTVIHLAGQFYGSYEDLLEANVLTTQKLLETGVKFGLKKIIYASSGAVYGESRNKNGSKENDVLNPNTFYGLSKIQGEECVRFFFTNYAINYTILRFTSIYGSDNKKGVIYDLLNDIRRHKEIKIYGDGKQTRHFLHVEDACLAIVQALKYKSSDTFNITSGVECSVNQIVSILQKKYEFSIKHLSSNNNLRVLKLDPSKSRQVLNFEPRYTKLLI